MMKMVSCMLCVVFVLVAMFGGAQKALAQETAKKAILVVSFGTSYADTRKVTIEACETKITEAFPEYEVRRAFTANIIINILKERDNIQVNTPEEALQQLQADGFTEVIVQPLHVINGAEFQDLTAIVGQYEAAFETLRLGHPLLTSVDDYMTVADAVKMQVPELQANEAVALMGHGTHHPGNSTYGCLQYVFQDKAMNNIFLGTVEGYPAFEQVVKQLKAHQIEKVTLMPFMLVAGDHAQNDMAGDEEDSWKTMLKQEGFLVDAYLHGLGENPAIQDIYVQHVQAAIEGSDEH